MSDDYQPPPNLRGLYESSKKIAFAMARRKRMVEIDEFLTTLQRERGKSQTEETPTLPQPRRWPSENLDSLSEAAAEAVIRGEEAGKREADAISLQQEFKDMLRGVVESERRKMAQQQDALPATRQAAALAETSPEEREKRIDEILTQGAQGLANDFHLRKQFGTTFRNQ